MDNVDFVPVSSDSTNMEEHQEEEQKGEFEEHAVCHHSLGWKSKSGIFWSHCNEETQQYQPGGIPYPGITRYATSHIADVWSSFDFFLTDNISQVMEKTNQQGQRKIDNRIQ